MIKPFIFLGFFLFYKIVFAQSQSCLLSEIVIDGLVKTNRMTVLDQLNLTIGQPITFEKVIEAKQELKNMQIFSYVDSKLDFSTCSLRMGLTEKWTTIPIVKFGSGGGTKYFVLGAYDVNSFGKYIELGGQYENFENNNSYVLWFRNPNTLRQKNKFGFDVWDIMREKLIYDSKGNRIGGYNLMRSKFNLFDELAINDWLSAEAGFELNRDEVNQNTLSDAVKSENATNSILRSQMRTDYRILHFSIKLGQLKFENYLTDGYFFTATHSLIENIKSNSQSHRNNLGLQYFKLFKNEDNLAFRINLADQNITDLSQQLELGGLNEVRGYWDGQFRLDRYTFSNIEYRKVLLKYNNYFHLQGALFYDYASSVQLKDTLNSFGIGLRAISPAVYRLNLRFDFVIKSQNEKAQLFSFGLQQFF